MRSSMPSGAITSLGMVGCVVLDHTVGAVTDLNGGAYLFGEVASVLWGGSDSDAGQ
jgi:hypothetical protein